MNDTLERYWRISLILGAAVISAVAALLAVLDRTTGQIEAGTAQIWQTGKKIANNTAHVPLLGQTNQILSEIAQMADRISQVTERLARAAAGSSKK
jgi:methyl-accepting chemotaxis protein